MARPGSPVTPRDEKFVAKNIRFPPALWSEIEERIPERQRSAFIRHAVEQALLRRAADHLQNYYATDREATEWAEFPGDEGDEKGRDLADSARSDDRRGDAQGSSSRNYQQ